MLATLGVEQANAPVAEAVNILQANISLVNANATKINAQAALANAERAIEPSHVGRAAAL